MRRFLSIGALVLAMSGLQMGRASAATLCAAPGGAGGCFSTIQAAVDAAASGDTLNVMSGTYTGTVSISKPVTLNARGTGVVLDATGMRDAITIARTANVSLIDLTIQNAGAMAIDVESSSNVTISGNVLTHNNLNLANGACPGAPAGEQDDCGGAIFLNNVTNSTVSGNKIQNNADGITLTDEAGPSSGNTLSQNVVTNNGPECGIVLASHNGKAPNGVFNNTVSDNISSYNGASGIGIFSPSPGTAAHDNIITRNVLVGNGHAGVTLHTHAPNTNDNNNQITNNLFSGNNTLGDDSAGVSRTAAIIVAAAVSPITGTVISNNTIDDESIGIFLGNATGTTMSGNTNRADVSVVTAASGTLPNPNGAPVSGVTATPYVWPSGPGLSSAFVVRFNTAGAATGEVLFGTSCAGLTMTATQDVLAGTTQHWIAVSGDELSSTGVGLTPGTTYYYAIVTLSPSGITVDNNKGACYSVTVPKTANSTAPPSYTAATP